MKGQSPNPSAHPSNLPCIKQIDRPPTDRIEEPEGVCGHTLPHTEIPIVKRVNRHEFGRVCTKFRVVRVLEQSI